MMNWLIQWMTWTSFIDVGNNFLGNRRVENYQEFVEKLLKSLQDISANVSTKVHFLRIIAVMWVIDKENDSIMI